MRHATVLREYDPPAGTTISTLEYEYSAAWEVPQHAHGSDQLIYAVRGVMEVTAGDTLWVVPPQFALWVPAQTQHSIRMARPVSMRTLYVRKGRVPRAKECAVLHVSPLLRELTLEAVRLEKTGQARARGAGVGRSDRLATGKSEVRPTSIQAAERAANSGGVPGRSSRTRWKSDAQSALRRRICECAHRPARVPRRDRS